MCMDMDMDMYMHMSMYMCMYMHMYMCTHQCPLHRHNELVLDAVSWEAICCKSSIQAVFF